MQKTSITETKQRLLALLMHTKKTQTPEDTDLIEPGIIRVEGIVEITNGKNHYVCHNKATQNLLKTLASLIAMDQIISAGNAQYINMPSYHWTANDGSTYMVIGSDTTHPTLYDMSNLTSPIGTPPGIKPNSQSFTTANPSNGVFRVVYTATWNGGAVTGTVGEIGLYLNSVSALKAAGWSQTTTGTPTIIGAGAATMTNRLSSADDDFTAFPIDTTVPLVIAWTIQFSF